MPNEMEKAARRLAGRLVRRDPRAPWERRDRMTLTVLTILFPIAPKVARRELNVYRRLDGMPHREFVRFVLEEVAPAVLERELERGFDRERFLSAVEANYRDLMFDEARFPAERLGPLRAFFEWLWLGSSKPSVIT